MNLIVAKVIKSQPGSIDDDEPRTDNNKKECAFIDGATGDIYNNINLKVKYMGPGKYIMFYTTNFANQCKCKKLNLIFYSKIKVDIKRISAK